ncbi:MAG TPA: hypothetical protein VJ065_00900 [Patescibacteria group bacterium]|nr:hypothetical protein [Patescibacteria group bacterium]
MSKEHKAHALRIKCIDWRFSEVIERDSLARGLNGRSDDISWPGASSDFDNVSKATALSIKLHDPDQAYIYEHEDCAAYGEDNSIDVHRENAYKLKAFLEEKKPNIIVTTLIATFAGIKEL